MSGQQGVVVTLDQVYAVLLEVRDSQRDLTAEVAHVKTTLADHEGRLRAAEARRWPVPVVSLLLAALSLGWSVLRPGK